MFYIFIFILRLFFFFFNVRIYNADYSSSLFHPGVLTRFSSLGDRLSPRFLLSF